MSAKKESSADKTQTDEKNENPKTPICGIVRPIAAMDNYSSTHWIDVHNIIEEAIREAGLRANLVSNADEVTIIHKTIVQNLYMNEIVVCDISGKNPNVMLELGMRLAFDKPTIVVKDDATPFSFDTSPIEHLTYPKDLRFSNIIEFQKKLTEKIVHTLDAAKKDENYSTFLKSIGDFTVVKMNSREVSKEDFIIESIKRLEVKFDNLSQRKTDLQPFSLIQKTNEKFDRNEEDKLRGKKTLAGKLSDQEKLSIPQLTRYLGLFCNFRFLDIGDKTEIHYDLTDGTDPIEAKMAIDNALEQIRSSGH